MATAEAPAVAAASPAAAAPAGKKKRSLWKRLTKKERGGAKPAAGKAAAPPFDAFHQDSPATPASADPADRLPSPATVAAAPRGAGGEARYVFSEDQEASPPQQSSQPSGSLPSSSLPSGSLHPPHSPARTKSSTSASRAGRPSHLSRSTASSPAKPIQCGKSVGGDTALQMTVTTGSLTAPSGASAGSPRVARAKGEERSRYFGMHFLPASEGVKAGAPAPQSADAAQASKADPPASTSHDEFPNSPQEEEEPQWTAEWVPMDSGAAPAAGPASKPASASPTDEADEAPSRAERRDRAVSEASEATEEVEVDAPPMPSLAEERRERHEALGVRVSVVTSSEAGPEKAGSDVSAPSRRSQSRRFGKGSMGKPLKKRSSHRSGSLRGSSPIPPAKEGMPALLPTAAKDAAPANEGVKRGPIVPPSSVQKKGTDADAANKPSAAKANKKGSGKTDPSFSAPSGMHLYAEISVPASKRPRPPAFQPAKGPYEASQRTGSAKSTDPSLANTSISSLTARSSLFAASPAQSPGFAPWCAEPPEGETAIGAAEVPGEYRVEDYFDYDKEKVDVELEGDGGILGSLLGVVSAVFYSTCRCFDLGIGGEPEGGAPAAAGAGNKSVFSGGEGMGATIIGTVHDTTATIANFSKALSQANEGKAGSNGDAPTFSGPVMEI